MQLFYLSIYGLFFSLGLFACNKPTEKVQTDTDTTAKESVLDKIPDLQPSPQDTSLLKKGEKQIFEALLGTWLSSHLYIKYHTPAGSKDSVSYFAAEPHNWAEVMKAQPQVTIFKKDGTVYTETKNLDGSIKQKATANWSVRGDTLFLIENDPLRTMRRYHVYVKDDIGEFRGLTDWDNDGFMDDEMVCALRNITAKK